MKNNNTEWQIQPVCKTCYYRRPISDVAKQEYRTYWNHTACFYFLDTFNLREGNPDGDYCPNYKPLERSEEQNE